MPQKQGIPLFHGPLYQGSTVNLNRKILTLLKMFGTFLFYMISKGPLALQILLVILVHRLTHHCHYGFPEDVNGDVYVNEVYDKLHAKKVPEQH